MAVSVSLDIAGYRLAVHASEIRTPNEAIADIAFL